MIDNIDAIFESRKLNRTQFLIGVVLLFVISAVMITLSGGLGIVSSLMKFIGFFAILFLMQKRCRDIGRHKYWFLIGCVPILGWWVWGECLFLRGKDNLKPLVKEPIRENCNPPPPLGTTRPAPSPKPPKSNTPTNLNIHVSLTADTVNDNILWKKTHNTNNIIYMTTYDGLNIFLSERIITIIKFPGKSNSEFEIFQKTNLSKNEQASWDSLLELVKIKAKENAD